MGRIVQEYLLNRTLYLSKKLGYHFNRTSLRFREDVSQAIWNEICKYV
jgi:hypothetical protein